MSRRRRALFLSCALVGAALVANGLYIPAKALLAQVLLERAFARALAGDEGVRPWSWADTEPVAKLRVPRLDVDVIALSGASGRTLAFGPGHIPGTSAPGTPGNVGFAGHRDTHFAFLEDVRPGDVIELVEPGGLRRYLVEGATVVDEQDVWVLAQTGADRLTLVTCWPFDALVPGGAERFVVHARAVDEARGSVRDGGDRGLEREGQLLARRAP